jgi:hypothetical protein
VNGSIHATKTSKQQQDIIDRLGKVQSCSQKFIADLKSSNHSALGAMIVDLLSHNQQPHGKHSSQPAIIDKAELLENLLRVFQSQPKSQDEINKYTLGLAYERRSVLQKKILSDLKY